MIDPHVLTRKLKRIEQFLRELETADVPATFDEFSSNTVVKRFVERNIELSIEQMIDICRHLVSGLDLQERGNPMRPVLKPWAMPILFPKPLLKHSRP